MQSIRYVFILLSALAVGQPLWSASSDLPPIPDRLDLRTAIEYGLEHNYDIRKARQRIREQEGLVVEIRARVLPNATLDASYTELDSGLSDADGFFEPITETWNVALNVRQRVYHGGGYKPAIKAQHLSEAAALLDLRATIDEALLAIETRFYDAILAREQIEVQEENIRLLEKQVQDARNRFEVGDVSNFEVLRTEVDLANAQPALIRARNRFRIAVEELRQSLGFAGAEALNQIPEFVGELDFRPVDYRLKTALDQALANRPDLKRLDKLAQAHDARIDVARSGRRPTVDVVGAYQLNRASSSDRFEDSLDGWVLGLQSSWEIFDGRRSRGEIIQARSRKEQALLDYQAQELAVEVEVRRAFSNLQEAAELAEASNKVNEQAEEALRLAEARYDAGGIAQLDVLQARVSLTQARTNQLEAYYSYKVAEASLRKAIGQSDPIVEESF